MAQPDNTRDIELIGAAFSSRRPFVVPPRLRIRTRPLSKDALNAYLEGRRQLAALDYRQPRAGRTLRLERSGRTAFSAAGSSQPTISRTVESAVERNRREYGATRSRLELQSGLTRARATRAARTRKRRRPFE